MEYVPGQTLGERLEAGPLPVAEACRAVRDAARGLAHAHAHGLVHRDVKPHNLIRSADGTTKVLDFGLAGVGAGEVVAGSGDGLTGAGMVVGTPDYIAPEQIADPHAADARADIYGLGCTLYHLLAGRPPLPDGTVGEKLSAQRTHEPDPIPGLPAALAAVLAKMMAKDPKGRYQSADEVVAALERCIRMADPVRRRRRRRFVAVAAGLMLAGLLIAAGVVFKIERDNQVITITTDDPDVEIVMKRKGALIRVIDAKTGTAWNLNPEKNEIAQADAPEGLTLQIPDGQAIVLKRNGREVITVTRTPKPVADTAEAREAKLEAATRAAEAWLKLIDAGEYVRAWEEADAITKSNPRDEFAQFFQELARKNGKPLTRTLTSREFERLGSGAPSDFSITLTYHVNYERAGDRTVTVGVVLQADGRWRVQTWWFDPVRMPPAGPGTPPPAPRLVQTIEDGYRFPQAIAYTPDGKALLAASRSEFAIYDPATGKSLFIDDLRFAGPTPPLAVSADGRTAAVESGDTFVYDLAARKRTTTIPKRVEEGKYVPATALSLTRDGKTLAAVVGREVVYHDMANGQIEYTRPDDDDNVRTAAAAYSPDGRFLIDLARVEPDARTRVSVRDANTHDLVARRELARLSEAAVHFSADGERLFVCGMTGLHNREFIVLGLPECKEIERDADLPAGNRLPIPSPDGMLLALVGIDEDLQIWDRIRKKATLPSRWFPHPNREGTPIPSKGPKSMPNRLNVTFAPDGRTLATARGNQIRVWDLAPAAPAAGPTDSKLQGTWQSMALTATSTRVTVDRGVFTLRRVPKGEVMAPARPAPAEVEGTAWFDPAPDSPHRFQVVDNRGNTLVLGIYRLEGDTLFLCVRKTSKAGDYPTSFATNPATATEFLVLKKTAAAKPDRDLILGTWRGVAAAVDGQSMPKEFIEMMKPTLTFTADKVAGKPQGTVPKPLLDMAIARGLLPKDVGLVLETGVEGVYHLGLGMSPRQIDFTILGEVKKTGLGIYELDGDTLRLCLSIDPTKVSERPTGFAARAGEKRVVLTLRRLTEEEIILEDVERRIDPAKTDGKNLPFALLERDGAAAVRFGKWLVVFEGVRCDAGGKVLFGVGSLFLPETGGRGNFADPGLRHPAPVLRQQADGRGNVVGIDRYQFQLEAKGARLVFADRTYEATDQVRTIVIDRDGTTRLEPPAKK
jgi:uncharacterized protein (TIGR03067 family)